MKQVSMINGNPVRSILLFAVPMLIGNIFQQFYNIIDSTVVGRFVGADALGAVGTTGSITGLLFSLVFGLTNGAGIIIAQCFGAGDNKKMRDSVTSLIYISGILSIVVTVIGLLLSPAILRLLNTPENILPQSILYMRIVFSGALPLIAYNAAAAVLRNVGDSKTPLYMLIISSLVNIVLDLVFVINFHMGVAGVAFATVIAQIVSAVLAILVIWKRRFELRLNGFSPFPKKDMTLSIIKTGLPASLQSSMISLGGLSVQGLVNSFGAMAMAAYTASTKIDSIAIQIIISIATSLSVFSGQNIGAGNIERIKKGLFSTLSIMMGACVFIAVSMLLFKRQFLSLFLDPTQAAEAVDIGCTYLSIIGIAYVIAGIMQSFLNVIRGAGDVNISMIAGISELSVRVIASYILVNIIGLTGLWIAIPISWGAGCIIPLVRYFSGKWTTKSIIQQTKKHSTGKHSIQM